jgi:hypothetical protein
MDPVNEFEEMSKYLRFGNPMKIRDIKSSRDPVKLQFESILMFLSLNIKN